MKQPSSPADPAAPGEEPASAKTREVAPGVFEIFLPLPSKPTIINVWLVDCGGPWALIDTGVALQTSRDALAGALASLGITPSSVTHLLANLDHHLGRVGQALANKAHESATGDDPAFADAVRKHRDQLLALCRHGSRQWAFFQAL